MNKNTKQAVAIGTRIYYTGDMANNEDYGTVTDVVTSGRWGTHHVIQLDDGRELTQTRIGDVYQGHGGTRFVTVAAVNKYWAERVTGYEAKTEMVSVAGV